MFRDADPSWLRRLPAEAVLLLAIAAGGCGSQAPGGDASTAMATGEISADGLRTVRSSSLDVAQVRPGIDLSAYSAVMLRPPELSFREPDRAQQEVALTADQRRAFGKLLSESFSAEIAKLQSLALAGAPAPGVLAVDVQVRDIVARVPPTAVSGAGRGAALLQAQGAATLTIELRDSVSNEILARGIDTATTEGVALRSGSELRTGWNDVPAVCARWARIARDGLDALQRGN